MNRSLYWASIVIPLLIIAVISITYSGEPNATIKINTQVQDYALQHNISISKPEDVTNMFAQHTGFGGAGGIANLQLDYIDVNAFIGELENNSNLDTIRYTEQDITSTQRKRTYFAFSSKNAAGYVVTDSQWYDSQWYNKPHFTPITSNLTTITYAKQVWYDAYFGWIFLLLMLIILWVVRWDLIENF